MVGKRIIIVGAGPGGLTAAMLLAHKGYSVDVFEKENHVGGRNSSLQLSGYKFDLGPTFLMMSYVLREMFELAGRKIENYLTIKPLEPMYRLSFADKQLYATCDTQKMKEIIKRNFPGQENGLDFFLKREKKRYELMYPCLQRDYSSASSMFSKPLLRALPHLSIGKNLFDELGTYFKDDSLRVAFTFQAKYLGMSPWQCPALYALIPYVEHAHGIDHAEGGLSTISDAMSTVAQEDGARVHVGQGVKKIVVENNMARGVVLQNGEVVRSDAVVINADFGYAMGNLFEPGVIRKYSPKNLRRKAYSCSTFMLYLGLDTLYDEPHHNIIFAEDYRQNIEEVVKGHILSQDMSVYVRNASITDPTLAPKGHSALYVLAPVPNTKSKIEWTPELTREYRDKIVQRITARSSMRDLESHIVAEKILTPLQWENDYSLFLGSTFNLGHNLSQMLYFRPRNRFEEVGGCYLVGGGTHPGSGLPTIYESARISSNLITEDFPL